MVSCQSGVLLCCVVMLLGTGTLPLWCLQGSSDFHIYMLAVKKHCFHKPCCQEIGPGRQTISKHGCPGKNSEFGTGIKKVTIRQLILKWFTRWKQCKKKQNKKTPEMTKETYHDQQMTKCIRWKIGSKKIKTVLILAINWPKFLGLHLHLSKFSWLCNMVDFLGEDLLPSKFYILDL